MTPDSRKPTKVLAIILSILVMGAAISGLLLLNILLSDPSHKPSLKLFVDLIPFGTFCAIIFLAEQKLFGPKGMQVKIIAGVLTGIITGLFFTSAYPVLLAAALIGGLLGFLGRYWIKLLEGL